MFLQKSVQSVEMSEKDSNVMDAINNHPMIDVPIMTLHGSQLEKILEDADSLGTAHFCA